MSERAIEIELLFGRVPALACFSCKEPFGPFAARHMGQDGAHHHFVLVTCASCGGRSVLAFYVERPEELLGTLSDAARSALEREQTLRALLQRSESAQPSPRRSQS